MKVSDFHRLIITFLIHLAWYGSILQILVTIKTVRVTELSDQGLVN